MWINGNIYMPFPTDTVKACLQIFEYPTINNGPSQNLQRVAVMWSFQQKIVNNKPDVVFVVF